MTGFHRNTISLIEQTGNPTVSQYFEIRLALELDPSVCFLANYRQKPRYKLSVSRKEHTKLTMRIDALLNTSFFDTPKSSKDVLNELEENYPEAKNIQTKNISVILRRMVLAKKLSVNKTSPRIHLYKTK